EIDPLGDIDESLESSARIERRRRLKFARCGTLVQLPMRRAGLSRREHLVWIEKGHDSHGRRALHVLSRGPFVAVVVDVDLDDILVRVRVINHHLDALVSRHHRQNAKALEPGIAAEEFVDLSIFEGDMLHPGMMMPLGIGGEARHLKEHDAMVDLIIAEEGRRREWSSLRSASGFRAMM